MAPPVRGYVRLDALVRRHPGWGGVGQYDGAMRRLQAAADSLPPPDRPDEKIAVLPALAPGGDAAAMPGKDTSLIAGRLTQVQSSLLAGLRSRREMARQDQVRGQRDVWRREARQKFPPPAETASVRPDLELQLLQANVDALANTLKGWKNSVPPAPEWVALRAKVVADHARLVSLIAARARASEAARTQHLEAVRSAREQRLAYVQTEAADLEAQLLAVDRRVLAAQQSRLAHQRGALLEALARPAPVSVPAAGNDGARTLPQGRGAGRAALSRASLLAARTRLESQKARWLQYLGDDTQAAARDAAAQHGWDVTFGSPRPGDRDLTQALAQALASGVWRPG